MRGRLSVRGKCNVLINGFLLLFWSGGVWAVGLFLNTLNCFLFTFPFIIITTIISSSQLLLSFCAYYCQSRSQYATARFRWNFWIDGWSCVKRSLMKCTCKIDTTYIDTRAWLLASAFVFSFIITIVLSSLPKERREEGGRWRRFTVVKYLLVCKLLKAI